MRSLEGLKAVVTGAAGGIGAPVTRQLREAGVHVVGVDQAVCPALRRDRVLRPCRRGFACRCSSSGWRQIRRTSWSTSPV